MPSVNERRFTESHEWFAADGGVVTVGITPYATNELTDITYVEMKPAGTQVVAGEALGEVESVKTASDIFSAVSGEIVEVNDAVSADPALLNRDPLGAGWLVRIRVDDLSPLEGLLDQDTYDERHPVD
ncbi:MAG: glycine cleavage system protein GcvH [Phycisphaerales bacterium]|nr:glycine cleavage system protein GcvH [Phycisphaerae bacterium]NNF42408.1 glycine cleavage system protein GcvH [Phycisphaerales bacterium]NNM26187.1 glycine cleavage system protein GcvH [Phycisphaerales bacterium]